MEILQSILAFVLVIGLLVTVHEFGHYWVARRLGVKVLRFSVGFGRALWRRVAGADRTEYVIAALPLGGYVKMLDEREGEVPAAELSRAFNRQPVAARTAIVAAGPVFNFALAIAVYWLMLMIGIPGVAPEIGAIEPDSPAAAAGLAAGDTIVAVDGEPTPTWGSVSLRLLEQAVDEQTQTVLEVQAPAGDRRSVTLAASRLPQDFERADLLRGLGIRPWRPSFPAVVDRLEPGSPGARAGLQPGDRITGMNGEPVVNWDDWVERVQAAPGERLALEIARGEETLEVSLRPEPVESEAGTIGRIGAYARVPDELPAGHTAVEQYGVFAALAGAVEKTWDMSRLTLQVLWRILTGEASIKNISGPVSIAQYAGQSAAVGLIPFLGFLAIVSVSLGVLNLLPIPMLDGGHLLYYAIEAVKGSPPSEQFQAWGQRLGLAALLALMALALYNDLERLFG